MRINLHANKENRNTQQKIVRVVAFHTGSLEEQAKKVLSYYDLEDVKHKLSCKVGTPKDANYYGGTSWDLPKEDIQYILKVTKALENYAHIACFFGRNRELLKNTENLLPRFLVFPLYSRTSLGWRMGTGEYYNHVLHTWFKGISEEKKREYAEKYSLPHYFDLRYVYPEACKHISDKSRDFFQI